VRRQNVRRWIHSAKPPNGHMAHQARPTTTIITKTRQNQTYQVMAAPKLSPGIAVPARPTKITVQKMTWLGTISRNWNRRSRTSRATRGFAVMSHPRGGSEGPKRSSAPARWGWRSRIAMGTGSRGVTGLAELLISSRPVRTGVLVEAIARNCAQPDGGIEVIGVEVTHPPRRHHISVHHRPVQARVEGAAGRGQARLHPRAGKRRDRGPRTRRGRLHHPAAPFRRSGRPLLPADREQAGRRAPERADRRAGDANVFGALRDDLHADCLARAFAGCPGGR
jgi:hypothetical protein